MAESVSALHGNCAEFITDDGRRFAWSESNCRYEEVPADGGAFTLLRNRLEALERAIAPARLVHMPAFDVHPRVALEFDTREAARACLEVLAGYARGA